MTISKKLSLLVLISTFFFIFNSTLGIYFNIRGQSHLQNYMSQMVDKQNLLLEIYHSMGYGEGIHAFKNYILRKDEKYYYTAKKSLGNALFLIKRYESYEQLDTEEISALRVIHSTIESYYLNLDKARELILLNHSISEVDQQVKIDDGPAVSEINKLQTFFMNKKSEVEKSILSYQRWTVIIMLFLFLVIYFIRRQFGLILIGGIKKSLHDLIDMTDQISEGVLVKPNSVHDDEISELGSHIYHLGQKICDKEKSA